MLRQSRQGGPKLPRTFYISVDRVMKACRQSQKSRLSRQTVDNSSSNNVYVLAKNEEQPEFIISSSTDVNWDQKVKKSKFSLWQGNVSSRKISVEI